MIKAEISGVSELYVNPDGSFLMKTMQQMKDDKILTDIVLKVAGKLYPAHKLVICANSPMLRNMFTVDTNDKFKAEIELQDLHEEGFKLVFNYMYIQEILLTLQNIDGVLMVSDYFGIETLKQCCLSFLQKNLNKENAVSAYQNSYLYCNEELQKEASAIILNDIADAQSALNELPIDVFKSILFCEFDDGKEESLMKKYIFQ